MLLLSMSQTQHAFLGQKTLQNRNKIFKKPFVDQLLDG